MHLGAQKRQRDAVKDNSGGKTRKLTEPCGVMGSIPDVGSAGSIASGQLNGEAAQGKAVVLVDKSVRANSARRKLAQECAKVNGSFSVSQANSPEQSVPTGPMVTHLVLGASLLTTSAARHATRQRLRPVLARYPGLMLVREEWLTQLTSSRSLPATAGFELDLDQEPAASGARPALAAGLRAPPPEGRYELWLGHWSRELDDLDDVAIMLQATFNDRRCARIGNAAIVAGLRELKLYELAIREQEDRAGVRALAYARAAAAVQACAFRITGSMSETFLVQRLPFVNLSCARIVLQLAQSSERLAAASACADGVDGSHRAAAALIKFGSPSDSESSRGPAGPASGQADMGISSGSEPAATALQASVGATCDRLELFRRDMPVRDSDGALRLTSSGAASRRRLIKLPGVGPSTAKIWYDKGCQTLDDAVRMVRSGQLQPPSAAVAWALEHHDQLTTEVTASEVAEMVAAVKAALVAATPHTSGWVVHVVGGGRRGRASHDVDLMVSHPAVVNQEMGDHFDACVAWLVDAGNLLATDGNCSLFHRTKMEGFRQGLLKSLTAVDEDGCGKGKSRSISDGLHYLFGVFRTRSGCLKRLDLLFCYWPWLPHAVLGWSGSTQFLRFLNQLAVQRGFQRRSHGLYSLATRQPVDGIRDEAGIFEALGLPYKEPQDRQCP